jgi:hypothetical protein
VALGRLQATTVKDMTKQKRTLERIMIAPQHLASNKAIVRMNYANSILIITLIIMSIPPRILPQVDSRPKKCRAPEPLSPLCQDLKSRQFIGYKGWLSAPDALSGPS